MAKTEPFERKNPGARVVLKRATADVPNDGRFHLFAEGGLVGSYRSEKAALAAYRDAVIKSGWKAERIDPAKPDFGKLYSDQFFDEYDAYWSRSSAFTPKGGKGR